MIETATASAMPSSTPRITTAAAVSKAMVNSWRLQARTFRIPLMSMSPRAMRKTIAARGGDRQAGQRPGEQEQDDEHHRASGELGQLAAPARAVGHLSLGGATVDDEGAR
jgi:hypothetical protein